VTADTSAIIAALSAWHEHHELAARAIRDVRAVPAHALTESYSVLTRLPGGLAVPGRVAADLLASRFPDAPLRLSARAQRGLPTTLADAGVIGGSSYDALVALEAAAHSAPLVTLDQRADATYRRLGVSADLLGR
jgi:predicted nucleic acid-binding protein